MAKMFKKKNRVSEGNEQVFRLIHNAHLIENPRKNWRKISIKIKQL